ncbi:hypothetical protein BY457_11483 [Marinilabilia salmonicolor]|jgi:hypothetical protein|uniref:transposase n=1 Tax=Marinilabilia salmonicolor TaxID=989 RepID=UPI000D0683FB|nr:transposase [Marinilabilia salmonicolor]PRY96699.1 hypothetical protein BY457_11483 [Marinilabilia salmonicolor]
MAKTKYDPQTWPLLAEGYAREGLTDQQIRKRLGVSNGTFYKYVEQYPEFKEALKRGKAPVDIQVENSLLKRALGYEYTETEKKKKNGKLVEEKETVKQVVPDTTAQIFWLKNRKPNVWRDKQVLGHEFEKMPEEDLNRIIAGLYPDSTNNSDQKKE